MDSTTIDFMHGTPSKNELYISNIIIRVIGWDLYFPATELLGQKCERKKKKKGREDKEK